MRYVRYFLAATLAVLGAMKLLQLTQDPSGPHAGIYAMTAAAEVALGAALVTRRFAQFAVWLGTSAMGGAVIGTLWAMTRSSGPTACKCFGATETSSSTVFIVQGALLVMFGLCLSADRPQPSAAE